MLPRMSAVDDSVQGIPSAGWSLVLPLGSGVWGEAEHGPGCGTLLGCPIQVSRGCRKCWRRTWALYQRHGTHVSPHEQLFPDESLMKPLCFRHIYGTTES